MRIRAGREESSASTTATYKLADGATLFLERIYYISRRRGKKFRVVFWVYEVWDSENFVENVVEQD